MNTFKEMYFPSSEARALNKRLREEHERFLLENPDWVPNELRLLPKIIARTLNKMCPKTPLMVPLGWIDGYNLGGYARKRSNISASRQ